MNLSGRFDYLVIGKGLIGSAAARHLSARASSVAIIGPDEPVKRDISYQEIAL